MEVVKVVRRWLLLLLLLLPFLEARTLVLHASRWVLLKLLARVRIPGTPSAPTTSAHTLVEDVQFADWVQDMVSANGLAGKASAPAARSPTRLLALNDLLYLLELLSLLDAEPVPINVVVHGSHD